MASLSNNSLASAKIATEESCGGGDGTGDQVRQYNPESDLSMDYVEQWAQGEDDEASRNATTGTWTNPAVAAAESDSEGEEPAKPWKKHHHESDDDEEEEDADEDDGQDDAAPSRLWEQLQEEDDDDEEDEYKPNEEDDDDDDEDDEDEAEENVLADLGTNAPTLLQPADVKRIRLQLRKHVQLLVQLLLFVASSGRPTSSSGAALEMLREILATAKSTELRDSLLAYCIPPLVELLNLFDGEAKQEEDNVTPSTCQIPITPRYQRWLSHVGGRLYFSNTLDLKIAKQKHNNYNQILASLDDAMATKTWNRTWNPQEISLLVLGCERFGGHHRDVCQPIFESLLPSRQTHTICRLIGAAMRGKPLDARFDPIVNWFKHNKLTNLGDAEIGRLMHGVALQCREPKEDPKDRWCVEDVDFELISEKYLPHRSGYVLHQYFENMCKLEK